MSDRYDVIDIPEQFQQHQCDNCDKIINTADLVTEIHNLSQRLEAGGEVPSGECPECGALTYPIKPMPDPTRPAPRMIGEQLPPDGITALRELLNRYRPMCCHNSEDRNWHADHCPVPAAERAIALLAEQPPNYREQMLAEMACTAGRQYDGKLLPSLTAAATRAADRATERRVSRNHHACAYDRRDADGNWLGQGCRDDRKATPEIQQPEKPAPKFRFGCPECKSDNVTEINLVEVRLPVTDWDKEGEPTNFGSWITTDDTIGTRKGYEGILSTENDPRYHCESCDNDFDIPKELGKDGTA